MTRFIWNAVVALGLFCLFLVTSFTAGYTAEKRWPTEPKCINSACDQPCPSKPQKFKRHAGVCR